MEYTILLSIALDLGKRQMNPSVHCEYMLFFPDEHETVLAADLIRAKVCASSLDMELSVVHLRADKQKMSVETEVNVRYINIPSPKFRDERNPARNENVFFRSVTYLLRPYVLLEGDVIFHLNFMNDLILCNQLKMAFPSARVVLTVHYMDWAFSLLGDKAQFLSILNTLEEELKTDLERTVLWSKKRSEELLHRCDRIITVASVA